MKGKTKRALLAILDIAGLTRCSEQEGTGAEDSEVDSTSTEAKPVIFVTLSPCRHHREGLLKAIQLAGQ